MNHEQFMQRFSKYPEIERYAIEHAYILSKDAHRSQLRKGGERYFEHPRRTALILMDEVGVMSWEDVCAALLHDGPEDTKYLTIPKLRYWFNSTVADLVDHLTKRKGRPQREYYQRLEEFDRAVIIKGCDRLDNLRSMADLPGDFIRKQIYGTQRYVLPLLERLGANDSAFLSIKAKSLIQLINPEMEKLQNLVGGDK